MLEEVSSAGILEEVEDLFNALRRARPSWNLLLNINLWLPDQLLLELLLVITGSFEEVLFLYILVVFQVHLIWQVHG